MPDLTFSMEGAEAAAFALAPQIALKVRVENKDAAEEIHAVALRCQLQIEVTRRHYDADEQEKLGDLFGAPERWGQTLRPLLWTHVSVNVPAFRGSTVVELPVPCTFDFNVAATKYFYGLKDGDVPLCLMFSGTIFYSHEGEPMQVSPISWEKEARWKLPVSVWRHMMERYYPNTAWLCLQRDTFERVYAYKVRHGIPTWEQALDNMLKAAEEPARNEETVGL